MPDSLWGLQNIAWPPRPGWIPREELWSPDSEVGTPQNAKTNAVINLLKEMILQKETSFNRGLKTKMHFTDKQSSLSIQHDF